MRISASFKAFLVIFAISLFFGATAHAVSFDSVTGRLDSFAAGISERLKITKANLAEEIKQLQAQETATTQTPTGQQINDAVEDSSFVPATKSTGTPAETFKRIAKQLLLLLINIAIYILDHKPLLYITVVVLGLLVLRLLWRMVGRQQF